mgnify:CR=1 FL=1
MSFRNMAVDFFSHNPMELGQHWAGTNAFALVPLLGPSAIVWDVVWSGEELTWVRLGDVQGAGWVLLGCTLGE